MAAKASETELVLGAYRGAPQRRSGRRSDWTRQMSEQFVATLAETCNVTLAAASIGRSISNVYRWKCKSASFRAAWDGALAIGYSRLELMLLERALHGVEKVVVARDGTMSVMRGYSDRVALTLLRMHRETAALAEDSGDGREHEEACARIIARLGRLKDRDTGAEGVRDKAGRKADDAAPEVETKGAGARLILLRRVLKRSAAIRQGLQARPR